MPFLNLCKNDDLLITLKDTFKANPIQVPEARIQPFSVFSKTKRVIKYLGQVTALLTDNTPIGIPIDNSQMANLSSTRTKTVSMNLGLQIMDGFLKGLGANAASISFAFDKVRKLSFAFENVNRQYVDIGALCKILNQRKFDSENPVATSFINEDAECLIVDSTITSNNFNIKVEESSETGFSFDIPAIDKILSSGGNNINVKTEGAMQISFNGPTQLAFAFTAFLLKVEHDGSIYYEGEPDRMYLTKAPHEEENRIPPPVLLNEQPGLSEIEL